MKKAQQGIFKIVDQQNQPQVMENKYLPMHRNLFSSFNEQPRSSRSHILNMVNGTEKGT